MKYTIVEHGDRLEKKAADFISINIQAYELIWQLFIGHQGNGVIAKMNNISIEDEKKRINFSQHHYTILESLYFMQLIVDDESKMHQIKSFEDYRTVINQIMVYQAYSGRLRDNMEECYFLIANKKEANEACDKLNSFYQERHTFIHGPKVPILFDSDKHLKISRIKKDTISRVGYSSEMPWDSITEADMEYLEDALNKSINELKPLVQRLLSNLFSFVKEYVSTKNLSLETPSNFQDDETGYSGYPASSGVTYSPTSYSGSIKPRE